MSPKRHGRKSHSYKRKRKRHKNRITPVAIPFEDSLARATEEEGKLISPVVSRQTTAIKKETQLIDYQANIKADLRYIGFLAIVMIALLIALSFIIR